jgi:hypothetical protein
MMVEQGARETSIFFRTVCDIRCWTREVPGSLRILLTRTPG